MPENIIDRLTETFRRFPGIGSRQARRFVYHLLHVGHGPIERLIADLRELTTVVAQCESCFCFYPIDHRATKICDLCRDSGRDRNLLMIIEKDADLEAVRQTGVYQGYFFVLGGLVPILDKDPPSTVRLRELVNLISKRVVTKELTEIIVALAVNPEGDHTIEFLKQALERWTKGGLRLTVLGRGLSTGTELEYSDADTIKNALQNRS